MVRPVSRALKANHLHGTVHRPPRLGAVMHEPVEAPFRMDKRCRFEGVHGGPRGRHGALLEQGRIAFGTGRPVVVVRRAVEDGPLRDPARVRHRAGHLLERRRVEKVRV